MSRWSGDFLASKREVGDPLADDTVRSLFESDGLEALRAFGGNLVDENGHPTEGLSEAMVHYLEATSAPPDFLDPAKLEQAQAILNSHGALIFIILVCAGLPECYVGKLGVPVLFLTQKLNQDITRRVVEVTKYMVDVMSPDGFSPTGRGLDSARKVRLMHAAIRYMILNADQASLARGLPSRVAEGIRSVDWQRDLGLPVNQEDMAYSLQTLGWVTVRCMRDLNVGLEPEQEEAIIHCWNVSGHYLGIDHDLLPQSVEEAQALFEAIKVRVAGESIEGKSMTAAVLDFAAEKISLGHLKAAPRVLTRYLVGDDTADMLGLPTLSDRERSRQKRWVSELSTVARLREKRLSLVPWMRRLAAGLFSRTGGVVTERAATADGRVPFELPESLADHWTVNAFEGSGPSEPAG
jgi:hypothetical protein